MTETQAARRWLTVACVAVFALAWMAGPAAARNWVVDQKADQAADDGPGTEEKPFKTIAPAAEQAQPGDTVLVRAGVYRECIVPARGGEGGKPITYAAAPDATVFVKGSDLYTGKWEPAGAEGVFTAPLDTAAMGAFNPYAVESRGQYTRRTCGQVCVDGEMLIQMDTAERVRSLPGTWMATEGGQALLVHFPTGILDPTQHHVEYTVRKACFRPETRGLGYLVIRGFHFEHGANQAIGGFWAANTPPQAGLVSCRSGHHWVIENNSIRWANAIGIDVGREDECQVLDGQPTPMLIGYHVIRGNIISDNGEGGLCGLGHIGTQIIGNVFERNNNLGTNQVEEAAIKMHYFVNGRIEGNLIRDNETIGIWLDNVWQNARITRNVILNNRGAGIMLELGSHALVDNNVIGLTRGGSFASSGIYSHDASDITIAHNFLYSNSNYGVFLHRVTDRSHEVLPDDIKTWELKSDWENTILGLSPSVVSNEIIVNNFFVDNHRGAINLPYPGPTAQNNTSDYNLFTSGWLETMPFNISTAGGVGIDEIAANVAKAEEASGVPVTERFTPIPYDFGVLVGLPQWQMVMDMDKHSAITRMGGSPWQSLHAGHGPWLNFSIDGKPWEIGCKPVEGVDKDFYGNPILKDRPLPGPFQNLQRDNHFVLWPIPAAVSD